jgi:peptide/nickel transport system permease protein
MTSYIVRRILLAIPLLLGILTILFFLVHLAPGDPTTIYLNPDIDPAVAQMMRKSLGLDQPLIVQYFKWIGSFLRGDFGYSYGLHRPVIDVIKDSIGHTALLSFAAIAVIFALGIMVGVISAVRQYSVLDNVLTFITFFFYSMPTFWLGLMLMLLFSYKLGYLPSSMATSFDYEGMSWAGKIGDRIAHLALPALALGVGGAAGVARYTRGSLLEVIRQDYIRTARSKGLSETRVILKHALRNGLITVVTLFGLYLPFLFSGAVLIETIFAWPGMGRVIVSAIFQRDYPLILANTFIFAGSVVIGNLVADIAYCLVDPRIRYD